MGQSDTNNKIADAVDRVKRDTREVGEALRGVAEQGVADVHENLNRAVQGIREVAETYYTQCTERTQEKPMASVLRWAGVGFVVGWLFCKRR